MSGTNGIRKGDARDVRDARKLLAVAALVASGCASGAATTAAPDPGPSATGTEAGSVSPEVARQAAVVDSVRRTYTPADVAFMAGMIHHHAQALVMSRMAPSHGASASLQVLAKRIINAQNDEIHLMQRWLRERGEPVPDPEGDGGHMAGGDHAAGHGDHDPMMPGMLTTEQMAALDAARGEEFDRLYLSLMIQHHQGALTMVEELVASPGGAREEAVFKLASDIGADQASEVTRMQTMLRDMLFRPEPSP